MNRTLIYPIGLTDACLYAAQSLKQIGFPLTDHPQPEVTHILMDIPSFRDRRSETQLANLLSMLPPYVTVIGGNLDHPLLSEYKKLDLLKDADYLAQNAFITADCALRVATPYLKTTFADSPALILGWGRIGKCLAKLLKALDCPVAIAARKESDRAMIHALNYTAVDYPALPKDLSRYQILFNTVPAPILSEETLSHCKHCVKIELASENGLVGEDIRIARGLPGAYAPATSGKLIASTFYRLWKEESP